MPRHDGESGRLKRRKGERNDAARGPENGTFSLMSMAGQQSEKTREQRRAPQSSPQMPRIFKNG